MKTMQGSIPDFDRKYSIQREGSALFSPALQKLALRSARPLNFCNFARSTGRPLKKVSMPGDEPIFEALQGGQKPFFDEKVVKARRAKTHQKPSKSIIIHLAWPERLTMFRGFPVDRRTGRASL
jgi:hypothetical protein